ncbi:hypothetical protein Thal_0024 [Thermocrinis albus DSM 14484]|uniref:Uncharacterized protein n=1 Tax=Thermocrinis albus (strain DSM 14484 / JCM 11386 / HI 11/12) TaxID=638303 RepID=D3SNC5_THEAH|nr:hypothetical protein [Thermocrinis albus]ADC88662.1 hypothetical protein Thal_0024 [Thermocrinis albus DSM 14484]
MDELFKKLEMDLQDPFKPDAVLQDLEELMRSIPHMKEEDRKKLLEMMPTIRAWVERNYRIALGWLESLQKTLRIDMKV